MKKRIINISVIDARGVSEDIAGRISSISNVGTIILNDKSELLLMDIPKTKIGSIIKTDDELEFVTINSKMTLDPYFLSDFNKKLFLTVNGVLEVEKGVSMDKFNGAIMQGTVNGKAIVPKTIASVIKTKMTINGVLLEYNPEHTYVSGAIKLNNEYLETYFGERKVSVQKLVATEKFDVETFVEEFDKIEVLSHLIATKANIKLLKPYLMVDQNNITIVAENTYYIDDKAELTLDLIEEAKGRNITVNGALDIKDESVLEYLNDIKLKAKKIVCHEELMDRVKSYCLSDQQVIVSRKKKSHVNYGTRTLNKAFIESFKTSTRYENYGTLTVDEDIKEVDFDRNVFKIENYGQVLYNDSVEGIVTKLVASNYGAVSNLSKKAEETKASADDIMYSNMGLLEL